MLFVIIVKIMLQVKVPLSSGDINFIQEVLANAIVVFIAVTGSVIVAIISLLDTL